MKKITALFALIAFLFTAAPLQADHGPGHCGKQCPMKGGYSHGKEKYACPIVSKLMKKAHFFLEHEKELGLSEAQVNQIKQIKFETKKAYIAGMAKHQIFAVDLKQHLSQTDVDTEAVNALIDAHTSAMATAAKQTVADYVKLKAVLSAEQMAAAKELWKSKK